MKARLAKKMLCFCLSFCMAISGISAGAFAFAEEPSEDTASVLPADCMEQNAIDLYDDGVFTCENDALEIDKNTNAKGVVFSGAAADIANTKVVLNKTFDFEENNIGRFCLDASVSKGQSVDLAFYLDDEETPFLTSTLIKQRKNNVWTYSKNITTKLDTALTGQHTLSFEVIPATTEKISFVIKSFEFVVDSVPVVYLNIDETMGTIAEMNASEDHSVECYGDMTIDVPAGYTSEYTGEELSGGTYSMEYIRGRGNSTWMTDKKPYKIKLDKKANLLGLGKQKHWVLLANYYDNSLLRNKATYWLGDQEGMAYTPQSEPVDVVMNGVYLGSYFLCEQVRVGENRVDIDDLTDTPEASDLPTITGGYLLGLEPWEIKDGETSFTTDNGHVFLIESPDFEGYSNEAQLNYIKNYVQDIEDALYSGDFTTEDGTSYKDLLDIESAAKYYWFQEFSMNGDGFTSGSCYLYKPRNDKMYFGPLWDFDYVAWGSTEYDDTVTKGWAHQNSFWNDRLFADDEYAQEVVDQWPAFKAQIEALIAPGGQLDTYYNKMAVSAAYNFEQLGSSPIGWESEDENGVQKTAPTYKEEIERLRSWISDRLSWVDAHVNELMPEHTQVTFKTYDGKTICVNDEIIGRELKTIPEAPKRSGYIFTGWQGMGYMSYEDLLKSFGMTEEEYIESMRDEGLTDEEISQELDLMKLGREDWLTVNNYCTAYRDLVLEATYVKESELKSVTKIYTDKKVYYGVDYGNEDMNDSIYINYQVAPFDLDGYQVVMTTDNDKVVKPNDWGGLEIVGPGDATVTLKPLKGASTKVKVHIYSAGDYWQMLDEQGYPTDDIDVPSSMTITKGQTVQVPVTQCVEGLVPESTVDMYCTDYNVLDTRNAGVIKGLKPGKATLIFMYNGEPHMCTVTVKDTPAKLGDKITRNGLKYVVSSTVATNRCVKCVGAEKNTITTATIPATILYKGKYYKVTRVTKNAFKSKKKLATVSLGRNVKYIESGAFRYCSKLKKVTIWNKNKVSFGKYAFAGISKKAVVKVPKAQLKRTKSILKGKNVRLI